MNASPQIQRRLEELSHRTVNYDPDQVDLEHPVAGWNVDDRCQPLVPEAPGAPLPGRSWEIAARLIRGYEFADPSIVRAFYDQDVPLAGRDMLLELRTLGVVRVHVGVRVGEVYDEARRVDGAPVRVFGWYYRTLQGHVEMGQMNWEVWKWLETGNVEFHVHAVSRTAPIANPIVRIGFWLLRDHEREAFLESTKRRMKEFTELAVRGADGPEQLREASVQMTERRLPANDSSHDDLARTVTRDRESG